MKHIYSFLIASFSVFGAFAQCEVVVLDTFVCKYGDELLITPEVTGYASTKTYEIEEIPYQYFLPSDEVEELFLADDNASFAISLGFDFEFFGEVYSEIYIGSNGWLSFSPNQPLDYIPRSLPNSENVPVNVIMAPWEDWNPDLAGSITYERIGELGEHQFVVSYNQLAHYNCGSNVGALGSFQIVLNQVDYSIETHIQQKPSCDTIKAVHGIQNQDASLAYVVEGRNATSWSSYLEGHKFVPSNSANYSWMNETTHLSNEEELLINPNVTGVYTLLFSDEAGCSEETSFNVEVYTALDPMLSRIEETLYSSINSSEYTYQWYLNAMPLEGETNPYVNLSDFGQYKVEIYVPETGCSYMSRAHLYTPISTLEMTQDEVQLYPNPTSGEFTVKIPGKEKYLLKVYNIQGQEILSENIVSGYHSVKGLNIGVYIVEISNKKSYSLIKKLLVK